MAQQEFKQYTLINKKRKKLIPKPPSILLPINQIENLDFVNFKSNYHKDNVRLNHESDQYHQSSQNTVDEQNLDFSFGQLKKNKTDKNKTKKEKIIANLKKVEIPQKSFKIEQIPPYSLNKKIKKKKILYKCVNNKESLKETENTIYPTSLSSFNKTLNNNKKHLHHIKIFLSDNLNSFIPKTENIYNLSEKQEKNILTVIEEKFSNNFKNKERNNSLGKALKLFHKFKSFGGINSPTNVNKSYSYTIYPKNKLKNDLIKENLETFTFEKKNNETTKKRKLYIKNINNDLKDIEKIKTGNKEQNEKVSIENLKEKSGNKKNDEKNKNKNYFIRKIIREEKYFIDETGKEKIIDVRQSVYDSDSKKLSIKKTDNNKTEISERVKLNKKALNINEVIPKPPLKKLMIFNENPKKTINKFTTEYIRYPINEQYKNKITPKKLNINGNVVKIKIPEKNKTQNRKSYICNKTPLEKIKFSKHKDFSSNEQKFRTAEVFHHCLKNDNHEESISNIKNKTLIQDLYKENIMYKFKPIGSTKNNYKKFYLYEENNPNNKNLHTNNNLCFHEIVSCSNIHNKLKNHHSFISAEFGKKSNVSIIDSNSRNNYTNNNTCHEEIKYKRINLDKNPDYLKNQFSYPYFESKSFENNLKKTNISYGNSQAIPIFNPSLPRNYSNNNQNSNSIYYIYSFDNTGNNGNISYNMSKNNYSFSIVNTRKGNNYMKIDNNDKIKKVNVK